MIGSGPKPAFVREPNPFFETFEGFCKIALDAPVRFVGEPAARECQAETLLPSAASFDRSMLCEPLLHFLL
jgi:hypothetical protein